MNSITFLSRVHRSLRVPSRSTGIGELSNKQILSSRSLSSVVSSSSSVQDETKLLRELSAKIRFSGPITIAEYMSEVLTNPIQGVYMNKDALGADGHFVTSPEISQMFGECIGLWLLNEWMKMGEPRPIQLVELGPGKGTLMNDILRTIGKLRPSELEHISLHLVEISPEMRKSQELTLCGQNSENSDLKETTSKFGCPIVWHNSLRSVPRKFSLFVAHEFLDALPIHKFVKTRDGWREILIDLDPGTKENKLRYIQSRNQTPSCVLIDPFLTNQELELCPQAGIVCKQISDRLVENGGLALLADYGGNGQSDSFRAFRKHKQVHPLDLPGTADLTADVDFKYLAKQINEACAWFGPISQTQFLLSAGIQTRCEQLVRGGAEVKTILDAYHALTNSEQMGERFKFACLFPKTMEPIHKVDPPVGFVQEEEQI
ncbi:protein arginine methyltransferase NDUFAF7, mitochondrial [Eurytemora carolleeae]|uniref:protein arginine methyltransferase NDUFAF7, mitochondrial n=1 Tax=Eurytemora carolleeae TaxID=1294199 RepID=UPI000C78A356|nr:protein arginine methyltransferase NDUFAF7, mitochondrial [Eurytemora carolleeae]|eukprot:XP_023323978.1 protein arginine methyltransferase NDUFAF7, mitochondrial-like [Eurytemora affinis]